MVRCQVHFWDLYKLFFYWNRKLGIWILVQTHHGQQRLPTDSNPECLVKLVHLITLANQQKSLLIPLNGIHYEPAVHPSTLASDTKNKIMLIREE